jgi:hypothetical protein
MGRLADAAAALEGQLSVDMASQALQRAQLGVGPGAPDRQRGHPISRSFTVAQASEKVAFAAIANKTLTSRPSRSRSS